MLLQCVNIRRVRKPIDLSVVCIAVWMETMLLHKLQQVSNVKEEEDLFFIYLKLLVYICRQQYAAVKNTET